MIENPLLINKSELKSKVLDQQIINLLDKTFQIPQQFNYNVIEVTKDFVARMDLISKQVYGTEKYQDVLCKLNGISNPFELNEGSIVVVPDFAFLDEFYYKEKATEKDPESSEVAFIPKAKQKNEKRKPNEAIIGDKRYKIDPTRKVIIY